MPAIQRWRQRVAAHHAQSLKAQGDVAVQQDFWAGSAETFRTDPHRTDDASLNSLLAMVRPEDAIVDVGGGGGRYALPLALRCKQVAVVEPSPAMIRVLLNEAKQQRITNLTAINFPWEEAPVDVADVVITTHVLYTVEDIEPFLRKLNDHARRLVVIHLFMEAPQTYLAGMWRAVHGERRINLPGMPELMNVMWELGFAPNLEILEASGPRTFSDTESWRQELRRRLYVGPGTEQDHRLEQAINTGLVRMEEGYAIKGVGRRRLGIAWWRPAARP